MNSFINTKIPRLGHGTPRKNLLSDLPYTKLVCTIGPASRSPEMIAKFIDIGMNVARLNFSHGHHSIHEQCIKLIREISVEKHKSIAILQDLQGPKIRTGKILGGSIKLIPGQNVILRYAQEQTEINCIPIDFEKLSHDVCVGNFILLNDGLLEMEVTKIENTDVHCVVKYGGILKSRKGVNFPQCKLSIPATTEKDLNDLAFGLEHGVDYIALSFVQSPEDIEQLREKIFKLGYNTPIIAKIEKMSAVEQIEQICAVSDGIMVARGDLGVECGFAYVASFQKKIIDAALQAGKPVIVATQMLESMIEYRRPTKAEICDVSNAVFEHADATMLSGESAMGEYPLEAVQTMRDILDRVDKSKLVKITEIRPKSDMTMSEIFARTTVEISRKMKATAIISLALPGEMVQLLAKYRPDSPIIAFSAEHETVRSLTLLRGVWSLVNPNFVESNTMFDDVIKFLIQESYVKQGDLLLIVGCMPISNIKSLNTLKVHHVT